MANGHLSYINSNYCWVQLKNYDIYVYNISENQKYVNMYLCIYLPRFARINRNDNNVSIKGTIAVLCATDVYVRLVVLKDETLLLITILNVNKKAVLSQGNRAMPQLFFSV